MQWTLPQVRSFSDVRSFQVIPAIVGCFQPRCLTTLRPRVNIMIRARRLALELPQILQLMKVGHCLGVPLLRLLGWNLGGADVHGHLAAQPNICVARHMDCAYRKVRVRRRELGIFRFERRASAKLAKIGFRTIKNILETPAGPVLLVLTLRKRRNSEKTRTKKRKKQRNFSIHDVPALLDATHLCCKQGQSRECPSSSERVLHRLQLRTNYPAVGKQTDGIDAPRVAHPYHRNRTPTRPRSPSSFDLSNALCHNPAWRKLLRGSPCLLSTANSQESVAS